jgi:hypothetical protein
VALRLNAPLMLQQFTNLGNAPALAIAKHSVVHHLTVISLSPDTVRPPLQPRLTFPPNLSGKITKVHISPWGFERTFPAQSLQKQAASSYKDTPSTRYECTTIARIFLGTAVSASQTPRSGR